MSEVAPSSCMTQPSPLKYCFHGQHSQPRSTFRLLPGSRNNRAVCALCYALIMLDRKQKKAMRRPTHG